MLASLLITFLSVVVCWKLSKKISNLKENVINLTEQVADNERAISTRDNLIGNLKATHEIEVEELKRAHSRELECTIKEHKDQLDLITAAHEQETEEHNIKVQTLEDELNCLAKDHERVTSNFESLQSLKETLDTEHLNTLEENEKLNKTVLAFSEKYEEMEKKYNSLLIENDFLKNYEVENTVLIKALRRLKEDDEADAVNTKAAISALETRLGKKIDATFAALVEKVATAAPVVEAEDNLSVLKRSELQNLAKSLGIRAQATWSNEKIREEIRNHKN